MIQGHEFEARWKFSPIVKFNPDFIKGVSLSDQTKIFLTEVGLPSKPFLKYDDELNLTLPTLGSVTIKKSSTKLNNLYVLYNLRDGYYRCLSSSNESVVDIGIDKTRGFVDLYLNSSLNQFVESVLIYREVNRDAKLIKHFWEKQEVYLPSGQISEIEVFTEEGEEYYHNLLRSNLEKIDPSAINHPKSFWRIVDYI